MMTDDAEILVLNRREAATFRSSRPYAIVSATDPDLPEPTYLESPLLRERLHLRFHDITYRCCERHLLFDDEHVDQLVAFAKRLAESDVSVLVSHCEAGISRSSAIAFTLGRYLGMDTATVLDPASRHRPNPFVVWRLSSALFVDRPGLLLGELMQWNADHATAMSATTVCEPAVPVTGEAR